MPPDLAAAATAPRTPRRETPGVAAWASARLAPHPVVRRSSKYSRLVLVRVVCASGTRRAATWDNSDLWLSGESLSGDELAPLDESVVPLPSLREPAIAPRCAVAAALHLPAAVSDWGAARGPASRGPRVPGSALAAAAARARESAEATADGTEDVVGCASVPSGPARCRSAASPGDSAAEESEHRKSALCTSAWNPRCGAQDARPRELRRSCSRILGGQLQTRSESHGLETRRA